MGKRDIMGHFANIIIILFTLTIVLNFGGGSCSVEYAAYTNETNGDSFAMGSPIDYIINEITSSWLTALGVLGGVAAVALLGMNTGLLVMGVLLLQALVNIFVLPIDCIHSLGLPEPLGIIIIIFINLYVLIMSISFLFNRDV